MTELEQMSANREDPFTGDINSAAALRAQYAIETPKVLRRRGRKKVADVAEEEQLVDETAKLILHSKKTQRIQKRQQKRQEKVASQPASLSLLDLPSEILLEVLLHLRPTDLVRLTGVSHALRSFVADHENNLARQIIQRRYWTLCRCLPLPFALSDVGEDARAALLCERRQDILNNHRKYYNHHVHMFDRHKICTCMTCLFAWNNLCLVLDLNHWQYNMDHREPIPMIPRGSNPQWNQDLLRRNADIVVEAMSRPLVYAFILEKHLATIIGTIFRCSRWKKKGQTTATPRPYQMSDAEAEQENDLFLDRKGLPSYDAPFHRDNYYLLEVYLPNRKWSSDHKKWFYYAEPPAQHEKDVEMVMSWMLGPRKAWWQQTAESS